MIKSYFKLGFRNLVKNKLSSVINILGLALAVGCCLVVFRFFDWSMHMDSFHKKRDKLFVVERISEQNGNQQYWGNSPEPMGPMLKADFPQVKNFARLRDFDVIIKQKDNVFRSQVSFVDNSFYQMFDFPVKWGNKQQFTGEDGIVLTNEISQMLFGQQNPVGKNLVIRFSKNDKEILANFTVKGVLEDRPIDASFYFFALVPYQRMQALGMDSPGDWKERVSMTFLQGDNSTSLTSLKQDKYLKLYNDANKVDKIVAYNFQSLTTMNFHAYKVQPLRFSSTPIVGYIMLLVIAIATLLIVYFNYTNIAMASASARLKEIGVRKVMGSGRKQIIVQFITENLILCTFGVLAGLLLAETIFLPWFSRLSNVDLAKNLFTNYRTWVMLVMLIIISALSGSAYPSFYISAFKPVDIMKGNSKMGSKNRFRKVLLSFQFFLTFLAISTTFAILQETKKINARPWGYNPSDNVVVTLDKSTNFEAFKNQLKTSNKVRSVTGSVQSLGNYTTQLVINADGKDQTVQGLNVLPGFATQLGVNINKGRDLAADFGTDQSSSVLVNKAFLQQMHWASGIGKTIMYEKRRYAIVGEVSDFHYQNFQTPIGPLVMMGCKPSEVGYVYVKTAPGLFTAGHEEVEKVWKKVNPNLPFNYYYQDSVFDFYFHLFVQASQILGAASFIMIVISITGIFGLALLILSKKMKEICVRKVLGAGMGNIIYLVNKEFIAAIGFAILFGIPMAWYVTRNLFDQVTPESKVSVYPIILSLAGLLIMSLISVSWHIFRAHTASPAEYLKDE